MSDKKGKKNSGWYRLAKVVYVILYLIALGLGFIFASESKPYTTNSIDKEYSYVQCKKDIKNNLVYKFSSNPNLGAYTFVEPYELDFSSEQWAKRFCGIEGYTFYVATIEKTHGSWAKFGWNLLLAFLIVYILMYLVAATFNYILFGESFPMPGILKMLKEDRPDNY